MHANNKQRSKPKIPSKSLEFLSNYTMNISTDLPFDFLHGEMVSQLYSAEGGPDSATAATKLEHMGFRVGHCLIERMTKVWRF